MGMTMPRIPTKVLISKAPKENRYDQKSPNNNILGDLFPTLPGQEEFGEVAITPRRFVHRKQESSFA